VLAVLYDVHGNLPALSAVLEDARAQHAEHYLLGGDYALFGPFPAETVATMRELPGATWIRGNVDRWCADPGAAPDDQLIQGAIADCRKALGERVVDELRHLQEQVVLDGTRYCHASPRSDIESFMPEAGERDEELLAGATEPRVVFGHTHLQFRRVREPDGTELVNPGSVGLPFDSDQRAAYALVDDAGSLELRRVRYDVKEAAAALEERFREAPWAQRSIARLRSAQA
jgi:predicted phosphodiesterase